MPPTSLGLQHLVIQSATDIYELFRLLGYDVEEPSAFEGDELDQFEFDEVDADNVRCAYIVASRDNHRVYLYEVNDLHAARLRGLAWNVLQRSGTGLILLTKDYREILFVDPRLAGNAIKSNVRVNKLKLVVSDPTRHDLDTLNYIHAHRRTGQDIYDAQKEAFNVNTITKKFYDEYRGYYERVRKAARDHNRGIREFQDEVHADKLHAFAQRLLGRLMFIYFLQRKGWMGGRQKFLTERFKDTHRQHLDDLNGDRETFYFYEEVLVPLFFDTFNTRRIGDATKWPNIVIPYLNGGLFDPARDPQGPILLPDSLFDPNSNEGLLAFFNRYNFTISEDTPLEQDVAVDPEMLGKVFENLLEERDRGQSGSFYTPRVIVAYMCQEALAGYLEESAAIPRDLTRAQFDPDSTERFTRDQAEAVNTALDSVTVLDPAVGSGSFLIGMMNEIIRLRRACAAALDVEVTAAVLADWKEAIIRDTLYGVDIKPEAIEVAQLRLWLALVVDQTLEQARPLPNLDYKLMAGNSLIETIDGEPVLGTVGEAMLDGDSDAPQTPVQLNFVGESVQHKMALFDSERNVQQARLKLDELRRKFFKASPEERKELRPQITQQERQIVYASLHDKSEKLFAQITSLGKKAGQGELKKADKTKLDKLTAQFDRITQLEKDLQNPDKPLPFFLYRMHFHEVFAAKGGFDIVVANPPYVRGDLLTQEKPELKTSFPKVYWGTADLYVYFFAKGFDLLNTGGQLAYITSNKYLRAAYGENLRSFLSSQLKLYTIVDFGDLPIFDAAAYPCIVLGSKKLPENNCITAISINDPSDMNRLAEAIQEQSVQVEQNSLNSNAWSITSTSIQELITKIEAASVSLEKYSNGQAHYGIKTGLTEAFVIDQKTHDQIILKDPASKDLIKPFLRGRDIERWKINWANLYMLFVRQGTNIENYIGVHEHLSQFKERLTPGIPGGRKAGTYNWYEIQDNVAYYEEFNKPKIVYQKFQVKPAFTMDTQGLYTNDAVWILSTQDYFLLGCLNSQMGWYEISRHCTKIQNGYQLIWDYFRKVRIPDAPQPLRDQIAAIARQCLDTPDEAERAALEARLNELVYQAYGLDADDIRVIEGYLSGQPAAVAEVAVDDSADE